MSVHILCQDLHALYHGCTGLKIFILFAVNIWVIGYNPFKQLTCEHFAYGYRLCTEIL